MNPTNDAAEFTQFVWRRLGDGDGWLFVLIPVLLLGLVFVSLMYRLDSRSVGRGWAAGLGLLRGLVYAVLAVVFLLPANQTWERSEKRPRVALLIDVSPSITTVSDVIPAEGQEARSLTTRLDNVVAALGNNEAGLVKKLTQRNPLVAYRFGGRLDEEFAPFTADQPIWNAERWRAWLKQDMKLWLLNGVSDEGRAAFEKHPLWEADKPGSAEWAAAWAKRDPADTLPASLGEDDRRRVNENRGKLDKRADVIRQTQSGTDVGDAALTLLNREAGNMLQGVVVVSDGRSNLGSESAVLELRARAKKDGVPVFTVLVGEDRQPVSMRITDVQTPEQAPPDEKFVVRAEIDGEGLPDQETDVTLDITPPGSDKPAHQMTGRVKFQPGEPPHAQAEFGIDPEQLPAELKSDATGRKELIEGEWKFTVRVPRAKGEAFAGKEHVSEPSAVQVIKKPLRVLLVAGGPTRDYQFLRTLIVREKDAKRAEVSVFIQNEGRDGRAVQDVEPDRLLNRFPTALRVEDDPAEKPDDRWYNLARYDLIVAFDPDWSEFTADQLALLQKWVDQQAGGLIVVAGPVNTYQLARDDEGGRLKPLRELLPVLPDDSVVQFGANRRLTKQAWPLTFGGATPEMEFLKLDEEGKDALAGWEEFFRSADGKEAAVKRGFHSYYPVKSVKPGAAVVATFADPQARVGDKEAPYLVTMPFGKGRVLFVGSGELFRLRLFKEAFFERFWLKLSRWASAGGRTRQNRRGVLVMGRQFAAGNPVRFEAQLFGPSLEVLPRNTKVRATVTAAEGGGKTPVELTAKSGGGEWAGWFSGRVPAVKPGDYQLDLPIPNSGDVLRGKFSVKESNPELDNTRPDAAALYNLAGDLDEILPRLNDRAVTEELRKRGSGRGDAKLFFPLAAAAALIPPCLPSVPPKVSMSRGAVDDLWDKGPAFGTKSDGKPLDISWVLLAVVGLLSMEWLTRKLLRLA